MKENNEGILLKDINKFLRDTEEEGNLWIGKKGHYSHLHYDAHPGFLCSVVGSKRVLLFDSVLTKELIPLSFGNTASMNPCHPNFPQDAFKFCFECEIQPSQVLYIPLYFFHYVGCIENNISVNFFVYPDLQITKSKFGHDLLFIAEKSVKSDVHKLKQRSFSVNEILNNDQILKSLIVNSVQGGVKQNDEEWGSFFEQIKNDWLVEFIINVFYTL